MVLIPEKPFTRTRLDEERAKDKAEVITLKLNAEEREALEQDKELLDIGGDSQTIKLLLEIGRKVLRDSLGEDNLRYLVSLKRTRYDARKRRDSRQRATQSNTDFLENVTLPD